MFSIKLVLKSFTIFIIFIVATIVLTACGAVTPYPLQPKNTPSPISTIVKTATFTPEPTNTPSPLDNYIQNIENLSERCNPVFGISSQAMEIEWAVYNCQEGFELFIIKRDGSKAWQIDYQQLSSYKEIPYEIRVINWSSDNQYVYFAPSYNCCWDPFIAFLGEPFDELWQFDLITGMPTNVMIGYDAVFFSPNEKMAIFICQLCIPPLVIEVYDLVNHKTIHEIALTRFPENSAAGEVVWSPNGEKIALLTGSGGDFQYYEQGQSYKDPLYSLVVIDLITLSQKVIVSESRKPIKINEITNKNTLLFSFYEYDSSGSISMIDEEYDLESDKFIVNE